MWSIIRLDVCSTCLIWMRVWCNAGARFPGVRLARGSQLDAARHERSDATRHCRDRFGRWAWEPFWWRKAHAPVARWSSYRIDQCTRHARLGEGRGRDRSERCGITCAFRGRWLLLRRMCRCRSRHGGFVGLRCERDARRCRLVDRAGRHALRALQHGGSCRRLDRKGCAHRCAGIWRTERASGGFFRRAARRVAGAGWRCGRA